MMSKNQIYNSIPGIAKVLALIVVAMRLFIGLVTSLTVYMTPRVKLYSVARAKPVAV